MTISSEKFTLLKDLCEGNSLQAKVANRVWLVLLLISVNALFANKDDNGRFPLLFGLNSVTSENFYLFNFFAVSLLSISFCSAHCQTILSRLLIEKFLKDEENDQYFGIKIRDYVDSIINPTFHRVGPIFRGLPPSKFLNLVLIILYIFLKILTLILFYCIPYFLIITFGSEINSMNSISNLFAWAVYIVWLASFISIARTITLDIVSIINVIKSFWRASF